MRKAPLLHRHTERGKGLDDHFPHKTFIESTKTWSEPSSSSNTTIRDDQPIKTKQAFEVQPEACDNPGRGTHQDIKDDEIGNLVCKDRSISLGLKAMY